MFENLCTFPLSSHLFAQAIHPTEAVLAVGLAGGHVESFRLSTVAGGHASSDDDVDDEEMDMSMSVASTGTSTIETEWRTRRHRGSCRTLAYSVDGEALYSSGTDRVVKAASSHTGRVFAKIHIPPTSSDQDDAPSLLHALSPQTLLLATDSAALHVYDLRQPNTITSKPAQTYRPHEDYITSLTPLPPSVLSTSGYSKQWVSTGGSTLAVTDLRKGIISRSEDQEEELLTSLFVGGLPVKLGKSKGEKLIVGDSSGVLTLWERGFWDDQQERIRVATQNKSCSAVESLALVPDNIGDGSKSIVVGNEDGRISIIKLGPNKIISTLQHDELEGVVALGFDVHNRLISGGGLHIKVWQEKLSLDTSDQEGEDELSDSSKDEDEESDTEDEDKSFSETQKKRSKSYAAPTGGTLNAHGIMKFQDLD